MVIWVLDSSLSVLTAEHEPQPEVVSNEVNLLKSICTLLKLITFTPIHFQFKYYTFYSATIWWKRWKSKNWLQILSKWSVIAWKSRTEGGSVQLYWEKKVCCCTGWKVEPNFLLFWSPKAFYHIFLHNFLYFLLWVPHLNIFHTS